MRLPKSLMGVQDPDDEFLEDVIKFESVDGSIAARVFVVELS